MYEFKLKLFGIAKDICGDSNLVFSCDAQTVGELKLALQNKYPALSELSYLLFAVNQRRSADDQPIVPMDEIAVLPPVSGG